MLFYVYLCVFFEKPHVDGPLFYPVVATINLKSHCVLDFYHPVDIDAPVVSSRVSTCISQGVGCAKPGYCYHKFLSVSNISKGINFGFELDNHSTKPLVYDKTCSLQQNIHASCY